MRIWPHAEAWRIWTAGVDAVAFGWESGAALRSGRAGCTLHDEIGAREGQFGGSPRALALLAKSQRE